MIRLLAGDCRDVLATLPADSVHCCVTSPPYFGLRDYGTASWDGGDADCQHAPQMGKAFESGTWRTGKDYSGSQKVLSRDCACGARRVDRQIGLEADPETYLATMVGVFREIRRVLRPDGTCWVNIGDSYASGGSGVNGWFKNGRTDGRVTYDGDMPRGRDVRISTLGGAKPKDLLLMPARLALALQADGWWVRSEITWCKKNPMPESVRDRPTNATEKVYLLTKNKTYFYDAIATREFPGETGVIEGSDFLNQGVVLGLDFRAKHHSSERTLPPSGMPHDRRIFEDAIKCATTILQSTQIEQQFGLFPFDTEKREQGGGDGSSSLVGCSPNEHGIAALAASFLAGDMAPKSFLHEIDRLALGLAKSDVLGIGGGAIERLHAPSVYGNANAAITVDNASEVSQDDFARHKQEYAAQTTTASRNMRNYWLMSTHAFPSAHFATFPPELAGRCVRAGTSERGVCAQCGAPWRRVTETHYTDGGPNHTGNATSLRHIKDGERTSLPYKTRHDTTTGWSPSCPHGGAPVPATVLDPFAGAGTTLLVADRLQRDAIGIELSPDYTRMAMARCQDDAPLFNTNGSALFSPSNPEQRQRDMFEAAAD